ncbi:tRNA preQ1(34) S-adenosylmethionine ribosyltransferase-isomerase QueA [Candidatus Peregrinibacteria bacterium]|nr:tRNA preQ1(34) S-adenosylmethionine ribosyltransferase-isomerase QueA [Candidatus Peregrinibacteria bacterium]
MRLSDFDYILPPELIAKEPMKPRDHSRLMIVNRGKQTISHRFFYELPDILCDRDVLVVNRSKVIPARLFADGCEILLLSPLSDGCYEVLVKPGRKFTIGARFFFHKNLLAEVKHIYDDGRRILRFNRKGAALSHLIQKLGHTPLPPYLQGSKASSQDYQTVYCREKGSVAAPTAGLHFTSSLLETLNEKNIQVEKVLLHVGIGTFQPVRDERIENHRMHEEYFCLSKDCAGRLNHAKSDGKRIIAVGTTSARVLESQADTSGILTPRSGKTDIFIYPGYRWRFVSALLTNFHLPKSTLFMLVCSFAGTEFMKKAYAEAREKRYRFYSFGDAMLII